MMGPHSKKKKFCILLQSGVSRVQTSPQPNVYKRTERDPEHQQALRLEGTSEVFKILRANLCYRAEATSSPRLAFSTPASDRTHNARLWRAQVRKVSLRTASASKRSVGNCKHSGRRVPARYTSQPAAGPHCGRYKASSSTEGQKPAWHHPRGSTRSKLGGLALMCASMKYLITLSVYCQRHVLPSFRYSRTSNFQLKPRFIQNVGKISTIHATRPALLSCQTPNATRCCCSASPGAERLVLPRCFH